VPRLTLAGLLAALVLLAAGCGGSSGSGTTSVATPLTTGDNLDGASTATVVKDSESEQTALLEAAGMSSHPTYDRIVFTFRNALPGYRVGYIEKPVTEDGSGKKVNISGDAVLSIRMEPASGFDVNTGEGVMVYKGPKEIGNVETGTKVISELVRTGDFEAVLTWAAGLPEQLPFRVTTDLNPPRLIVDVKVPAKSSTTTGPTTSVSAGG
jgi:hypothetical protein